jgi:hypothetical protein
MAALTRGGMSPQDRRRRTGRPMTPERWRRITAVFRAAQERDAQARAVSA